LNLIFDYSYFAIMLYEIFILNKIYINEELIYPSYFTNNVLSTLSKLVMNIIYVGNFLFKNLLTYSN